MAITNLDILDKDQKEKLRKLIDDSALPQRTKQLACEAIDSWQHYKMAHGQLHHRCQQLEREIEALRHA